MTKLPFLPNSGVWQRGLFGLALCALLAACGGGGGAGGTGGGPPAAVTTAGTVTGFGSVIVDGTEIEDALANTYVENADGSTTNVALKLGQQVRVEQPGGGAASVITVGAAVIGAVSSVTVSAGEFKAAGQWVKVNSDTAAGPVTVYGGGYTALGSMAAGDLVEVHGSAAYSTTKAAYVIQASRVEKKASISAIRLTGKIASLNSTARSFAINGVTVQYTNATVVPAGSTLANDQSVVVWGASGALAGGTAPVLTASRLRVLGGADASNVTSGSGQVSGLVSGYNATAKTFAIDGINVSLGSAAVAPAGASVGNGAYVQVSGSFGANGVLAATSVRVQQQNTSTTTATLRLSGAVSNYVSTTSFVVRGVPVDASAIVLATACPGVTLTNGSVVSVTAVQQTGTDVVKASRLECKAASGVPIYTMRTLSGTAGTVDSTARTFVLTITATSTRPAGTATTVTVPLVTTQKVLWSEQTAWGIGVSANSLNSAKVVAEGYLDSGNSLVARSIRLQGTEDVDRYSPSSTGSSAWDDYDRDFRPGKQ
ncbi:MAG: putative exported protein [Pseudomonadota bacterium]